MVLDGAEQTSNLGPSSARLVLVALLNTSAFLGASGTRFGIFK
jgi:hypothetical protein